MPRRILLDTNVLLLFVVGGTSIDYISKHKNVGNKFDKGDYDDLILHLAASSGLITTSNILSETSNLLRQISDPIKSEITNFFKVYILETQEIYVPSNVVVNDEFYNFLGLNDVSILHSMNDDLVLITDDGNLHSAACGRSINVLHFSELKKPSV